MDNCELNNCELKQTLIILYIVVVVIMAIATFVEKAGAYRCYDQWWFTLAWALLAAASVAWFLHQRIRRLSTVLLHLSFVIILTGALLTRLSSAQGMVHLRQATASSQYLTADGATHDLPFALQLDTFRVICHPGTTAAADYESHITIIDHGERQSQVVSMNNICTYRGYRFYQSSYDADGQGSLLAMNSDPWGIPVTYTGYALLFVSLVWMLLDPKGAYRHILQSPLLRRGALSMLALLSAGTIMAMPPTLPQQTAEKFGHLNMVYNNRVCPVQTYAIDFTKKLHGKARYKGLTAEQVLTGFIFYPDEWSAEPLIKVKGTELKQTLQLSDYASVNDFFHDDYLLGALVRQYHHGSHDAISKEAAHMDDRLMVVMQLQQGTPLKMFPHIHGDATEWLAPTDNLSATAIPSADRLFMSTFFMLLYEEIAEGHYDQAEAYIEALQRYQQQNGGRSLPSPTRLKAEYAYNAIPFATILFMLCLTMGFITLGITIWRMLRPHSGHLPRQRHKRWPEHLSFAIMVLAFISLTVCEGLRWIISGSIPMSNGYETMLLMAWFIMLLTLVLYHRYHIMLTFGFLLSGFFLLVSHLSQMDPQIGHLMPVLRSPLLTLHVSIIMMSFALLSFTFICGAAALSVNVLRKDNKQTVEALAMLSRVFLYPAIATLGIGIFIGAIWANVSWGTYWSWDPKEVWALITFMAYAAVVHTRSIAAFQRPLTYHIYVTLCFLTILMTYFGVNYFLGGMHSYA